MFISVTVILRLTTHGILLAFQGILLYFWVL